MVMKKAIVSSNLYNVKIRVSPAGGAVKQNLDGVKIHGHIDVMTSKPTKRPARAKVAKKPVKQAGGDAPYHHGDLREALLKAAESILERDGPSGLTLRAAAREAGVSHAAPTHHFGDMGGLLSELAAAGFRRFGAFLAAAADAQATPEDRLNAMGEAYVAFARRYPGLFLLMFRSERLDVTRPALRDAIRESFQVLSGGVARRLSEDPARAAAPLASIANIVKSWSIVHGFAMLLLDHRLDDILKALPEGVDAKALLRAVIEVKPR
jgi:AcrR family transcriptional regulator